MSLLFPSSFFITRNDLSGGWSCDTYSSCRRRLILALASASSTERCCRLSVLLMLGESPGDWVGWGASGESCTQSLSWVSSTIVWAEREMAGCDSCGFHYEKSGRSNDGDETMGKTKGADSYVHPKTRTQTLEAETASTVPHTNYFDLVPLTGNGILIDIGWTTER